MPGSTTGSNQIWRYGRDRGAWSGIGSGNVIVGSRDGSVLPAVALLGDLPHRGEQSIDVLDLGGPADARAHRSRQHGPVAVLELTLNRGHGRTVDAQKMDHERMSAEAAVADPDPVFGAQHRGEEPGRDAGEVERHHTDPRA